MKDSKLSPKETSSAHVSEAAVVITSLSNVSPARRVSDPDIHTRHQHHHGHNVSAGEDTSIASSHSSDDDYDDDDEVSCQVSCQPVANRGSQDETARMISRHSSISSEELNTNKPSRSTTVTVTPETTQAKANPSAAAASTQLSFQDMFQKWHSNRVVKRKYPSVKAFPALKPFDEFHEYNTAEGGYTFGPYFDRWYAKQQGRSKEPALLSSTVPTRKRPSPTNHNMVDASPRSAKKLKFAPTTTTTTESSSSPAMSASSIQQQRNLNSLHKWNAVNALYRSEIVQLPACFVPGPYTVIMGRRLKAPGCVYLRHLTDQYAREYKQSDGVTKSRIVTCILKAIYEKAPIGAFVRCKARRYYEVEDLIAREKIVSELIAGGLQIGYGHNR